MALTLVHRRGYSSFAHVVQYPRSHGKGRVGIFREVTYSPAADFRQNFGSDSTLRPHVYLFAGSFALSFALITYDMHFFSQVFNYELAQISVSCDARLTIWTVTHGRTSLLECGTNTPIHTVLMLSQSTFWTAQ